MAFSPRCHRVRAGTQGTRPRHCGAAPCPWYKEKQQAMKRKVATIINNMCQLVNDPSYVLPFIDRLIPGLERAEEEMTGECQARSQADSRAAAPECGGCRELKLPANGVCSDRDDPHGDHQARHVLVRLASARQHGQVLRSGDLASRRPWLLVDRKDFEDASWSTVLSNHIDSVTRGPVSPEYAPEVIAELKTACFMALRLDVD